LSDDEAAAIPYGGLMALYFLGKAKIERGQRVLVYGASGANGTCASVGRQSYWDSSSLERCGFHLRHLVHNKGHLNFCGALSDEDNERKRVRYSNADHPPSGRVDRHHAPCIVWNIRSTSRDLCSVRSPLRRTNSSGYLSWSPSFAMDASTARLNVYPNNWLRTGGAACER
jgi:hypothetical protein